MEIPNVMRGYFYPTTRISRCPSYSGCFACRGCQNYNKHALVCVKCESRKPEGLECSLERHPDYIQWCLKELTKRMNMPMFHPDKETVKTEGVSQQGMSYVDTEYEQIINALTKFSHLGSIKQTAG